MNVLKKGFTLIELLVVIGIMAVIAAGVIATINPAQKIAQARDAQTQNAVAQVAGALQSAAAVNQAGLYPATLNDLTTAANSELTVLPALPAGVNFSTSGLGTAGPACVWANMLALRNTTVGTNWCWCSNLGTARLSNTCP